MSSQPARSKWSNLRFQIGFVLSALAAAGLGVLLHGVLTAQVLATLAERLEREGAQVLDATPGLVYRTALVTLEVLIPLLFVGGLAMSCRVLAPMLENHPEPVGDPLVPGDG